MVHAIHSGGQTGADQGGLAAAVALGLGTGGWVPAGWRTEDGPAPWLAQLGLQEHPARGYPQRTRLNVRETDGTFWFGNPHSPGGKLTLRTAREPGRGWVKKPVYIVEWRSGWAPPPLDEIEDFREWLVANRIGVLNVAGNRESSQPGIRDMTRDFLVASLRT